MMNWETIGEWLPRRWSVVVVAACALAVTTLSVGGAAALLSEEQRQRDTHSAHQGTPTVPVIPAIVTEDAALAVGTRPGATDQLLGQARVRSDEAVTAGEAVYAAASERATSDAALQRLRDALDVASEMLDGELAQDATVQERQRLLHQLDSARASVLDAAAEITTVRRVPTGELGSATTALAVPDDESLAGEPVFEPNPTPAQTPEPEPSDESSTPAGDQTPEPSTDPDDDSSGDPSGDPSDQPEPEPSGELSPEPSDGPSPEPSDEESSTSDGNGAPGGIIERQTPSDESASSGSPTGRASE